MAKTAEIKKFKSAFLKPKAPKGGVKLKTKMEKAVALAKKKTGNDKDNARSQVSLAGGTLKNLDEDYLVDLLAYKLTKHWDEPDELESWFHLGDPKHKADALRKVLGPAPSDDFVLECWHKFEDSPHVTALCYELKPDVMIADALKRIGDGEQFAINCPPMRSKVTKAIFAEKGSKKTPQNLKLFITPEDAVDLAEANPRDFVKFFFSDVKPSDKASLLKMPRIRAAIKTSKRDWKALCKSTPMLPFLDDVQKRVKDATPEDLKKETAKAVFEKLLSEDSPMPMTYYTNQLSPPYDIMGSSKASTMEKLQKHRDDLEKGRVEDDPLDDTDEKLASLPNVPGCQCDELVTLLQRMMQSALGPDTDVECKHHVIPGMVLTVKMSTLPGGLLKKTFGGNVYDDADALTGQVLFTGNPDGDNPDAHTVLKVGDTYFDAVLGTKGQAVFDAVAEEFGQWDKKTYKLKPAYAAKDAPNKPVWVAKSKSSGNWIIKQPGLKAAANNNGFNSAYRMTTKLTDYVETI